MGPNFLESVNLFLKASHETGVQAKAQLDWEDGTYLTFIVTPPGFEPHSGDYNPATQRTEP